MGIGKIDLSPAMGVMSQILPRNGNMNGLASNPASILNGLAGGLDIDNLEGLLKQTEKLAQKEEFLRMHDMCEVSKDNVKKALIDVSRSFPPPMSEEATLMSPVTGLFGSKAKALKSNFDASVNGLKSSIKMGSPDEMSQQYAKINDILKALETAAKAKANVMGSLAEAVGTISGDVLKLKKNGGDVDSLNLEELFGGMLNNIKEDSIDIGGLGGKVDGGAKPAVASPEPQINSSLGGAAPFLGLSSGLLSMGMNAMQGLTSATQNLLGDNEMSNLSDLASNTQLQNSDSKIDSDKLDPQKVKEETLKGLQADKAADGIKQQLRELEEQIEALQNKKTNTLETAKKDYKEKQSNPETKKSENVQVDVNSLDATSAADIASLEAVDPGRSNEMTQFNKEIENNEIKKTIFTTILETFKGLSV